MFPVQLQKNPLQMAVLLLLLVAIAGPWTFSIDGAPPAEYCSKPFFLMNNGRCGGLVSGITVLSLMVNSFFSLFFGVIGGTVVLFERWFELVGSALLTLLLLPLLSTLLEFRSEGKRPSTKFRLLAFGIGSAFSLFAVVMLESAGSFRFWGLWLYLLFCWLVSGRLLAGAIKKRIQSRPAA